MIGSEKSSTNAKIKKLSGVILTGFDSSPGNPRVFPAVGRCIYCANSNGLPLSKEHIIPESIGGAMILLKSSCPICAGITSKLERVFAQKNFDFLRKKFGILQKKKHRKVHPGFDVTFQRGNSRFTKKLTTDQIPPIFSTIKLITPLWYRDMFPTIAPEHFEGGGLETTSFKSDISSFLSEHNADGYFLTNEFDPEIIARVLAKIAHSYTIAQYGFEDVDSDLVKIILGNQSPFPLVGSASYRLPEPPSERIHNIWGITMPFNGENVIVVFIRLFAKVSSSYFVIRVGRDHSSRDARGWQPTFDGKLLTSRMMWV